MKTGILYISIIKYLDSHKVIGINQKMFYKNWHSRKSSNEWISLLLLDRNLISSTDYLDKGHSEMKKYSVLYTIQIPGVIFNRVLECILSNLLPQERVSLL